MKLRKLTVVLDYYEAKETYSRIVHIGSLIGCVPRTDIFASSRGRICKSAEEQLSCIDR